MLYPPAMIEYGQNLLEHSKGIFDISNGFAYLLAAKTLGGAADKYIDRYSHSLTPEQHRNALMHKDYLLENKLRYDYSACSN